MSNASNPFFEKDEEDDLLAKKKSKREVEDDFALPTLDVDFLPSGDLPLPVMIPEVESSPQEEEEHSRLFQDAEERRARELQEEQDRLITRQPQEELSTSLEELLAFVPGGQGEEELQETASVSYEGPSRPTSNSMALNLVDEDNEDIKLDLDAVLGLAIERNASDVHLDAGDEVTFTIRKEIVRVPEFGIIDANTMQLLQQKIVTHVLDALFTKELELDTSYVLKKGPHAGRRTRLSIDKSVNAVSMTFRLIADVIPTPESLGVPKILRDWMTIPNGLILVNGPTNSGKTTTLASLMQEVQLTQPKKIITLEKPIEFLYDNRKGLAKVHQREVGKDTHSFAAGLKSALRQAPNIIMVGEVRDREEVEELLKAADTGHLAISTLHTNSAPAAITRIQRLFEGDEQLRILSSLAEYLRGTMNQVLLREATGRGMVAVREILPIDSELSEYIASGNTKAIRTYQQDRGITMEHELIKAVRARKITAREARGASSNPRYFDELYEA